MSDCHQQRVLVFSHGGAFRQHFPLRTQAGNQVRSGYQRAEGKEPGLQWEPVEEREP